MKINNFDQSSTGTNIEISCYYDSDRARYEFEESIEILQHSGYGTNTIAYYKDHGNVKGVDSIEFDIVASEDDKILWFKSEGYNDDDDLPPLEDFKDYIFESYGERITLLNFEDFNKVFLKYNIQIKPSKNIEKIITRGYSQGDYAEVFYCPDDLEKAWGNKPNESDLKKEIDRLFWDQPIYAMVTINGEEFLYDEICSDSYVWNAEIFAEHIAEKSGVPIETIAALLPKEVTYE